MNKRYLYESIMDTISLQVKKALLESDSDKEEEKEEKKYTFLKEPFVLTGVELVGPIFEDYDLKKWLQKFVNKGGGCYNTSVREHTFVCNTTESAKMLKTFIDKIQYRLLSFY